MIARVDGPESINFPFNINIFNGGSGRSFASSVITHRKRGSRKKMPQDNVEEVANAVWILWQIRQEAESW